jgi:hypothetical protein
VLGKWRRKNADPATLEAALPGITAIPWGQLRSGVRSTSEDVPALLVAIATAPDEGDLTTVREDLAERLSPDGLLFQVTPYAVPFLVRIAQDPANRRAAFLAQLILEPIAYGDPHADEDDGLLREVARGLADAVEFLYRQATDPEPKFRAQAVALLAPIDGRSARFADLVTGLDDDELVAEAVRDAREYLADVENGDRPPLPGSE